MIVYIIIIYPIKFYLAYGRRQYNEHGDDDQPQYYKRKKNFYWIIFGALSLLFIISTLGSVENLHKLFYVKSENYETVEEFSNNLNKYIGNEMVVNDSTITPMLQITSFGGGLKSNLWTLLTMSSLDDAISAGMSTKQSKKRILDYTISLSGVSGGAVGLGNYLVLDYMNRSIGEKEYNRDQVIQNIGNENILAIDVSGIFGHDRMKETFTFGANSENPNYDRSFYAMQRYMKILSKPDDEGRLNTLKNASISEYWKLMKTGIKHNPALIINTASTGFQPGVAFSLSSNSIVFPGYIQLSDVEEENGKKTPKDLRYYDAISTSNRFPVMSPAGQIENEGFFLDGGYFDNSGLLTTQHFNNELSSRSDLIEKYPIGTLVILNGKADYVRRFIQNQSIKQTEINESTNASAIISGITNIDKLPNVLLATEKTYKDAGDSLFTIFLPHPISIDDIYASLSGEFIINDEVFEALRENNRKVNQALVDYNTDIESRGIVVPPLARTLSRPAVDYETAMVRHHPDVKAQIKMVVNYIKNGINIKSDKKEAITVMTTEEFHKTEYTKVEAMRIIKALPEKVKVKKSESKINASAVKRKFEKTKKQD